MKDQTAKLARIEETRDAATAWLDDIRWVRSVLEGEWPNRSAIRRITTQLRLMLLDRQLQYVASPRIGRLELEASEHNGLKIENDREGFNFLIFDMPPIYKMTGVMAIAAGTSDTERMNKAFDEAALQRRSMTVDQFLSTGTLALDGRWINRRDIINFVAYNEFAIHLHPHDLDVFKIIKNHRDRLLAVPEKAGDAAHFMLVPYDVSAADARSLSKVAPTSLNLPLLQLFAIANGLVDSPDVRRLEDHVAAEVNE